jgi:transposase InsO family protein
MPGQRSGAIVNRWLANTATSDSALYVQLNDALRRGIRSDNGSAFAAEAGREWLEEVRVRALCIKTGKRFKSREYWSILRSGAVNLMTQAIVDKTQPRSTGLPALIGWRQTDQWALFWSWVA